MTKAPIHEDGLKILSQEALRLRTRFLNRVATLNISRLLILIALSGYIILHWNKAGGIESEHRLWVSLHGGPSSMRLALHASVFLLMTLLTHFFAGHEKQGRRVVFFGLCIDLFLLSHLATHSGGLQSPFAVAIVLYSVFFALLFHSAVAVVPPLLALPFIMKAASFANRHAAGIEELSDMLWFAIICGSAISVIVYLTAHEEKQSRDLLQIENALRHAATVNERNRLSRDIHDGLGGSLSGLIIQIEYLQALLRKHEDEKVQGELRELKGSAEECIDEVRRALTMMRDEFDLIPQFEKLCTTYRTRNKLPVTLEIVGEPSADFSDEQQLTMFRIIQECLTNISKHAKAERVRVSVAFEGDKAQVIVEDNGVGFDFDSTPEHHYGLINMQERAQAINGSVHIRSAPGAGCTTTLNINAGLPEGKEHAGLSGGFY